MCAVGERVPVQFYLSFTVVVLCRHFVLCAYSVICIAVC